MFSFKDRCRKAIFVCFFIFIVLIALVWIRSFYGSMSAYHKAKDYLGKRNYIDAVTFFDRSIHWYTPFNPYVHLSAEGLWKMSRDAESRKEFKLALITARTIRRGFYSARSFYTPGKKWIEKCDKRIERLWAIQKGGQGEEVSDKGSELVKTRVQNQESRAPDPIWGSVLLLGLFGWVGSIIVFILRGFHKNSDGRFFLKPHLKWLCFGGIFFFIWVVGMMRA